MDIFVAYHGKYYYIGFNDTTDTEMEISWEYKHMFLFRDQWHMTVDFENYPKFFIL